MNTIPEPLFLCNPPGGLSPKRTGFRVPFGLRDGRVWAPAEVARGKACGCVCPGCLAPLAAKALTSRRRRPHFAHLSQIDCETGCETGTHLRAKQIIEEHREMLLPAWTGDMLEMPNPPTARDAQGQLHEGRKVAFPATRVVLHEVEPERWLGSYKPDIAAVDEKGELLVEIRVTHGVDDQKAARVQAHGRRMIEIDLSSLDRSIPHDPDAFLHCVLFDPSNRNWISFPQAVADWNASKEDLDRQILERNRQLSEQRSLAAKAAAERTTQATREAKDKASRREYVRKLERAKHAEDLASLMEIAAPAHVEKLLSSYQAESDSRVGELLLSVTAAVRSACLSCHPDAWIFGVDPALWQLLAYDHFVGKRQSGFRFNQRQVASWVRQAFPYQRALYRLFVTQYAKRADARRAGYQKRRLAYWAFTEEENELIPNFYTPINSLMDRLAYMKLIRLLPSPIGECEVC